ncbi:ATP-dependent DNA helicase RecG [Halobacteriovorax sp.]|uniref:ATP-dependent DNA helicase RecG n=1 Tax=Halobacteriovorax sp. TaxID=2020862 RepID=UPI0035666216
MKSSPSNISNLTWDSKLEDLSQKGPSKSIQSLIDSGHSTLQSLLWIIPLRIHPTPVIKKFESAYEECLFTGIGKVISVRSLPSFKGRGRNQAQLLNITVVIQDHLSKKTMELKWFNAYPSIAQKIQLLNYVKFTGKVQIYGESKQIINPDFESTLEETLPNSEERDHLLPHLKIQYPTVNGVNSTNIKKIIDKIPHSLWNNIQEVLPKSILNKRKLMILKDSLLYIHGKTDLLEKWDISLFEEARTRLIYEEFLEEQFKIHLRRVENFRPKGIRISCSEDSLKKSSSIYPYDLTLDQKKAIKEVCTDMESGLPMMRLLQGDVGCGKTSVAITSGLIVIEHGHQAVLMCPTETLANQHYLEIEEYCSNLNIEVQLLVGSLSQKKKNNVIEKCKNGEAQFIIGTHALIQDSVEFKSLALSIIDEQHKFGVEQRLKLIRKGVGSHCLIMSATPIPRSLSMTQYGDLNISTISTLPNGRKGHKTKIVQPENFGNFLNFVNTRVQMGEQVYIVVPAITENPKQDMLNLEDVLKRFKDFFPKLEIQGLHGQLKSQDKDNTITSFKNKEIDILIATSVIEVGINIINATIMAIMNPERFGLSSLHQLRGRVGRGHKPGFCFLVIDNKLSSESMTRLRVIENYTDGFKIAEEDLKIRGAGDIFGKDQSGSNNIKKIANIITDFHLLEQAREDALEILNQNSPNVQERLKRLAKDAKVFSTV